MAEVLHELLELANRASDDLPSACHNGVGTLKT